MMRPVANAAGFVFDIFLYFVLRNHYILAINNNKGHFTFNNE